jgi:glycolate oxidase iron-sulfur subunit
MGWVTPFHPSDEGLAACVQCGLCLPVCPTFRLTGRETASPRGRLQAMSAVATGVAEVDAKFEEIIDFCLGCRACEPVCPGMVPYGELLEGARAEIDAQRPSSIKSARGVVVGRLLRSGFFLSLATIALRVVQVLNLGWLVPPRLRRSVSGMRPLAAKPRRSRRRGADGPVVGLLLGCVQERWFHGVNTAAIELLIRAGFQVRIPPQQTCCGALAAHDGHAVEAAEMSAVNEDAFAGCDIVVATAAGCSAHLTDTRTDATDITAVIAGAIADGLLPVTGQDRGAVVVQDPCHLRHAQGLVEEPRSILRAAGYQPIDLDDEGLCCGAAGLYTVLQPKASMQLGEWKADLIGATGESLVSSSNPGCEMQLRAVLGHDYRIAHPIELYLEAIGAAGPTTNVASVENHI